MNIVQDKFVLKDHCHVNTNNDGDRFVGVKIDSNETTIFFPIGYNLPDSESQLKKDIRNLIRVLTIFTDKQEKTIHKEIDSKNEPVIFPIHAYMNVINYYLEHNGKYYVENEPVYRHNARGRIDWNRTVKTQRPYIQNNSAIYLDSIVKKNSPNANRIITRINKYCVYEAFDRIGIFYTSGTPEIPDISIAGNGAYFIKALYDKLSVTNNDNDKKLFQSMISMITFIDSATNKRRLFYGTDTFETVWEKLIDRFFGEKNKEDYFPHAIWTERFGANKNKVSSALMPDSIMIYNGKFYVLDAKYYRYGVYPELGPDALPHSSDINKQITYAQYLKNNQAKEANVFNAFIMPFNCKNNMFGAIIEYLNVAEARGDWIHNPKDYEKIQGIVVDTRYLLNNYDGSHDIDKQKLSAEIEKMIN